MHWPHTHAVVHDPDSPNGLGTRDLLEREWLLTQGGGGFAMGTALGVNTRRYHGLLVAASRPPVGRIVVLNQLFEQLELHGHGKTRTIEFGGCLFLDDGKPVIVPDCPPMLRRFDRGLDAVWSYQCGDVTLTRRLVLHDGEPACTVHYDLTGLGAVCSSATLRLRPMVTLRDFHRLEQRDDGRFGVSAIGETLQVAREGLSACYHAPGATADAQPDWWFGVHHRIEAHRGTDSFEDLFVPGVLSIDLGQRDDAHASFTACLGQTPAQPIDNTNQRAERLAPIRAAVSGQLDGGAADNKTAPMPPALPAILAQASDDFIVRRRVGDKQLSTIIAGYPWFADWGRDTFIALPGLMLCTRRFDEARDTLAAFADAIDHGLVPNRFDDHDPTLAHYNTVDGSMWFVHSALEYLNHTGDDAAWDGWLAGACVKIVEAYRTGTFAMSHDGQTKVPIRMDSDGLIAAGDGHSQLTWMDAAAWGPDGKFHVFTPRPGKCVEINGLWHSALVRLSEALPDTHKQERERYGELSSKVCESFTDAFWSEQLGYLVDHLAPTPQGWVADGSLRPNQLIACALEHGPVQPRHREHAVNACRERLLTPVGPRTLPVDDAEFFGRYEGSPFDRDKTYHRGMVWPWLMGPYCESVLRAGGFSDDAKREVRDALAPLLERLTTSNLPGALGTLHEIHEPLPPFAPRGCPAQAWSVAEVLRVLTLVAR
ncbi:MAG: amylo-alpha-1,6-glucosidase [Phycisphaeraceae bacterium]